MGDGLDPRHNSLNFLRLVLAGVVLLSHAYAVGGFGNEGILHHTTAGTVAVYGFFGISGYLIAGSATAHSAGRYLWQRFLRILPAFWVSLIVVSFGFALIGWASQHHGAAGYFDQRINTPAGFDYNNWLLDMRQFDIGAQGLERVALDPLLRVPLLSDTARPGTPRTAPAPFGDSDRGRRVLADLSRTHRRAIVAVAIQRLSELAADELPQVRRRVHGRCGDLPLP